MTLASTKMGLHEWAYSNNYDPVARQKMHHVEMPMRFRNDDGGGAGLHGGADARRGRAVPQLRHRDALHRLAVHRVRRVHRHLPRGLPDDRARTPTSRTCARACWRRPTTSSSRCSSPAPLKQTGRVMVKDENVCLHCGLCAERCPTYAWDMRKFVLQHSVRGDAGDVIPLPPCEGGRTRVRAGSQCASRRELELGELRIASMSHGSHQRVRVQDRHGQRHRVGVGQRPDHAGDLPDGRAGHRARTSSRRTSRGCRPGTRSASTSTATPRARRTSI